MNLSARKRLKGRIFGIEKRGGEHHGPHRLGRRRRHHGEAYAVIKASDVMVGVD